MMTAVMTSMTPSPYSANVIGRLPTGNIWGDILDAAAASCMLSDDVPDGTGWLALVYRSDANGSATQAAAVMIAEVGHPDEMPRFAGRVVAVVSRRLVDGWWGEGQDMPPVRAGGYIGTHAIGTLLAAITHAPPPVTPGQRLASESRVRTLVCETLEAWRAETLVAADADTTLGCAERRRLAAARTLIDVRYSEKLTIEAIARSCGMGRARLIRGFRQLYGRTVADVLAERRLSHAATALRATDSPVAQIAHASGYCSNAAFTRAFVRHYGAPPSLFRVMA